MILSDILEEHADEATFLWLRRRLTLDSLQLQLHHLTELEQRLEAHLDGLGVGGEAGWDLCLPLAQGNEAEGAFVAWMTALASQRTDWLEVLEASLPGAVGPSLEGIAEALRLSRGPSVDALLRRLVAAAEETPLALALDAISFRRTDPGAPLRFALAGDSSLLRRAAYTAAGRLRLGEATPAVRDGLNDGDPAISVPAFEAAVLLGTGGRALCAPRLGAGGSVGAAAARLLGVIGAVEDRAALERAAIGQDPETARAAVLALGNLGVPDSIPWLLDLLEAERMPGVVGVVLRRILGSEAKWPERPTRERRELPYEQEFSPEPPEEDAAPPAEPEDEKPWEPDDDLPVYLHAQVRSWWESNRGRFESGLRYRAGGLFQPGPPRPESPLVLRHDEALEEALAVPGRLPRETRDLAVRQ